MKRTAKQRHGLEVAVKPKKYADGGKVEGEKTMGPATAAGRPIGYGDVADITVNTAKGIGRAAVRTLKGDSKGADEELARTREQNREISERAADRKEALKTINGAPIRNPSPARLPPGAGGVRG